MLAGSPARAATPGRAAPEEQWPTVLGDPGGTRFSALTQINRGNVSRLKIKWTYRHGDYRSGWPQTDVKGTVFEATPIVADGKLIFSTPFNRVIALDPQTGRELWTFDPKIDKGRRYANKMVSRGVAFWHDRAATPECASRVFATTLDARLIALDADSGVPCATFGAGGTVNLLDGIEGIVDPWEYNVTSPPTVVGDSVVVGSSIVDLVRRIQPAGAVRAFDARTGKLLWRFDTIPRAGQEGSETWLEDSWRSHGGANVWSMMTADHERGLVFLPVSGAGPDHHGGDRPGENLFANSVVALDARTGKRIWHFQTVHHDLWDYDLAAPPLLATVRRHGRLIDAVAQLTKSGFVFVLDRETGVPLFPVEERAVPRSDVPRERAWPTQPIPARPPALLPQRLTEADLWDADRKRLSACKARLARLRNEGLFTPPSVSGTLLYPGPAGGVNWPGGAFDPERGRIYVPVNNVPMIGYLDPLPPENYAHTGDIVLQSPIRALRWLRDGRGTGLRYHMIRREYFLHDGLPCNRPPWGMLVAVNLNEGEIDWSVPLGRTVAGETGALNFGPPLATAAGLVFVGGTADRQLRVFDATDGALIAQFELPAGLHAGPMTYMAGGKQYLVVTPGGHASLPSRLGDWVIAYTVPD
jgi:quinoprotein glucose dehydrogenase